MENLRWDPPPERFKSTVKGQAPWRRGVNATMVSTDRGIISSPSTPLTRNLWTETRLGGFLGVGTARICLDLKRTVEARIRNGFWAQLYLNDLSIKGLTLVFEKGLVKNQDGKDGYLLNMWTVLGYEQDIYGERVAVDDGHTLSWECKSDLGWYRMDPEVATKLEAAYQSGLPHEPTKEVTWKLKNKMKGFFGTIVKSSSFTYEMNWKNFTQVNVKTKKARPVRRRFGDLVVGCKLNAPFIDEDKEREDSQKAGACAVRVPCECASRTHLS